MFPTMHSTWKISTSVYEVEPKHKVEVGICFQLVKYPLLLCGARICVLCVCVYIGVGK